MMFIILVSSVGKIKKIKIRTRNQASILRISPSDALLLSHRATTLKYAITRSICNTFPAYSYDKQCQKRHMCEQNKIETRRRNIFLYRYSYTEFKTDHLCRFKPWPV